MEFLQKLEPHITSEDIQLQKFALHILSDIPTLVPEEWTVRIIKDSLSNKEKETNFATLDNFPMNEEAAGLLIKGIKKSNPLYMHLYLRLLKKLDFKMVQKYKKELQRHFSKTEMKFYKILESSTEIEILGRYAEILKEMEEEHYYNSQLYRQAKHLAGLIVENGWITEEKVELKLMEQLKEPFFDYEGILIVYMIGLMKLKKFIPLMSPLLERDEDILLEEVAGTLKSFQSDEVVESVYPLCKKEESSIFALSVLGGTKTPLAVEKLKELFHEITDPESKDLVFEGLCRQLALEGLPEIEEYLKEQRRSFVIDVEETAYGYYRIMNLEHQNLESWQELIQEKDDRSKKEREGIFQPSTINPVVKETTVGRNDPCPCGSGKKYKKCCGK
ncbi:SEC-C metal-binding domain-containing protein [Falsibacillus pallidus]|uniref:SEC-C motif-containing protein n=1 Tax=Falsibacillus pallidus TaxID=493781 RepID=A0A370GET8_9BACI|nr:SEC-C metal-binding domain-containing protein [Falsibacillus pallidus]RDI42191.1 SEC-C motif-containing protein [Falsibacillus pallidus]